MSDLLTPEGAVEAMKRGATVRLVSVGDSSSDDDLDRKIVDGWIHSRSKSKDWHRDESIGAYLGSVASDARYAVLEGELRPVPTDNHAVVPSSDLPKLEY